MSSVVKVKLNRAGVGKLLKSSEIQGYVQEVCNQVQKNAGSGYSSNIVVGKYRAIGRVFAYSKKAISDNYKNNTLLKALHR